MLRAPEKAKMIKNVVKVNHERSVEELKMLLQRRDQARKTPTLLNVYMIYHDINDTLYDLICDKPWPLHIHELPGAKDHPFD